MHSLYQKPHSSSRDLKHPSPALRGGGAGLLGKQHEISQPPPDGKAALLRRLERFELQSIASEILGPHKSLDRAGNLQPPRVCKCLRVPRQRYVEVWKSKKNDLAYYGGLVICGSVWDCLPCAAKISEKRGSEIKQAVESWEAQGGSVQMLTLTFPHYENQKCKPLRDKFQAARKLMKNRKTYKRLMVQIGLSGDINRTEVTYGKNGWHVHCHTILFTDGKVKLSPGAIFEAWATACVDSGLPSPSGAHGVKISSPKEIADYIAKQGKETSNWTLDKEMTKGHIKRGGIEGMTPFDLLRSFRDTKNVNHKRLFVEYSKTFKGTRQLVWSKGLKAKFHIEEVTDEEAAESTDELDELMSMIEPKLWAYIRKNDYRGKLLEAANLGRDIFAQALDVLKSSAGYVKLPF